jgi:CHAD domain-containing protein
MNAQKYFPLASHLAGNLRAMRRRYCKRLARCREELSEQAVHELRIQLRHIRALLDLLHVLRFRHALKKADKSAKKLLDAFDALRDTQVQLRLLKPLWTHFPDARGLQVILERNQSRFIHEAARTLKSSKPLRLEQRLKKIEKQLDHCADTKTPAAERASVRVAMRKSFQIVTTLRRRVRKTDSASIHRMRVAFKRYRYLIHFLEPQLSGLKVPNQKRMKGFQDAAGDVQDLHVLLQRIAKFVKQGKVSPTILRPLRNELLRRKERAIDSFMARIDELFEFRIAPRDRPRSSNNIKRNLHHG